MSDPLLILEWVFFSDQAKKTIVTKPEIIVQLIIKARTCLLSLSGKVISIAFLPLTFSYLNWLLRQSEHLQISLINFPGHLFIRCPKNRILSSDFSLFSKPLKSDEPLKALTLFTDGSGKIS